MLKALGWLFGLILIVVIGGAAFVLFNAGSFAKDAIETFGPDYLGASVSVNSVDIGLAEGSANIDGLTIGNPAGYEGPHAMQIDRIAAVIDPQRTSDLVVALNSVVIDGADIAAVAKGNRTNFQALVDHLDKAMGPDTSDPEMKFIIDKLEFTNVSASLSSDLLGNVQMNIPPLNLQDIGTTNGGATGAEIAEQILKPLSASISREAVNQGLDIEGVKTRVRDKIKDTISDRLRGLTDRLDLNKKD